MTSIARVRSEPSREDRSDLLDTRYGAVRIEPERVIAFRPALLGFAAHTRYVLTEIPEREVPFRLLQAVDDGAIGFLVLPLDLGSGLIGEVELRTAAREHGYDPDHLVALGIVTLRAEPGALHCTINLRAPILIDAERRVGCQHVLANEGYDLRHPLLVEASAASDHGG